MRSTRSQPTLRLYSRADTIGKLRSSAGRFLAATAVLAVVTALFGLWFALGGSSGPSAADTAAKATTLLAWATEPGAQIDANASPATLSGVRLALAQRQRDANACLEGLRGGAAAPATVDGVACTAGAPSFWHDKENAGLVGAVLGVLVALLAGCGSLTQLRAGRSTSG